MSDHAVSQAFAALQRLLVVVDPDYGESGWQVAHSFLLLPPDKQSANHWYRGRGSGFIHVDENLNGQYVKELPADVDPASVIDLPPAQYPRVLATMKSLLPKFEDGRRPEFESRLNELTKASSPTHAQEHTRNFQFLAQAALMASQKTLLTYLRKQADFHYQTGMIQGSVTGTEAAAALLIQKLAEAIARASPAADTVFQRLVSTPVISMEQLSAYMVRDCIQNGFSQQAYEVLRAVLSEGNGLVEGAREGLHPVGHPETMLDLYYFGLLGAAPYLRAAMVGYEVAARNPALSDAERKTYATRGNAAEEKLVRVSDAMMFAVKDLDGSQSRVKRAEIQKALATGNEDKAQGLAMEAVDLKLFYPKPFKQVLLEPDAKA